MRRNHRKNGDNRLGDRRQPERDRFSLPLFRRDVKLHAAQRHVVLAGTARSCRDVFASRKSRRAWLYCIQEFERRGMGVHPKQQTPLQ
jgi:hypothetical protein